MITEKGYDAITIRDITDRADIGYATFFRHYNSKDDLMLAILADVVEALGKIPKPGKYLSYYDEGLAIFEHVAANPLRYRCVLASVRFRQQLHAPLAKVIERHLDTSLHFEGDPVVPPVIVGEHIIASILAIIEWWLANNQPYPIDKMAFFYQRLVIASSRAAMNPTLIF